MLLEQQTMPFAIARSVNASDNGYPSRVPTTVEPVGTGAGAAQAGAPAIQEIGKLGAVVRTNVVIVPFGTGVNDQTFALRVIGWRVLGLGNPNAPALWIPVNLCELSCTLGNIPGIAGSIIPATMLFADICTLTVGNPTLSADVVSPTNDTIAHVRLMIMGFQKLEIVYTTGGSAVDCNALIAML